MFLLLSDFLTTPLYIFIMLTGADLDNSAVNIFVTFILSFFVGFLIAIIYKKLFSDYYNEGTLGNITLFMSVVPAFLLMKLLLSKNPETSSLYSHFIESGFFTMDEILPLTVSLFSSVIGFVLVIKPRYFVND